MSVTQPASGSGHVSTTVRRRLRSTFSRLTARHGLECRGPEPLLPPGLLMAASGLMLFRLGRDLPGLYLPRGGGGVGQYVLSPLSTPFRVVLGTLLLGGIAVLATAEMRGPDGAGARTMDRDCQPRRARVAGSRGDSRRRRSGHERLSAYRQRRLIHGQETASRRTVTRGRHTPSRPPVVRRPGLVTPASAGAALACEGMRASSRTRHEHRQRAETRALTVLTGYLALSIFAVGAAVNAGVPAAQTLRGLAVAVALALPPTVPILLRQASPARRTGR